jgi:hypothetical protein
MFDSTFLITMLIILVGVMVGGYFVLRHRPAPSAKPVESGVPQATGPFDMSSTDIVETEYAGAGRLRIWRRTKDKNPFEEWRIEPVRHTTFAIGNLDADHRIELVAPGHCREFEKPGDIATSKIRFFLNAYKYGFRDWWKTTFYDPSQCVIEKDNYEFTETLVGDADNVPGNEIVLLTAHALSVFRYDEKAGEIRLVSTLRSFVEGVNTLMRSAVIADIDGDGRNEILATAHEGEEGAETPGKAWLILIRWQGGGPSVSRIESLPGLTSVRSLKIGDVVPGGSKEAAVACYRVRKGIRYGYITIWSFDKGFLGEKLIDEVGEGQYGSLFVAVGDLSPDPGDEVLVARNNPNEIISLFWRGQSLAPGPKMGLDARARINNIQIGRTAKAGFHSNVLVSGTGDWEGQLGKSFIELINFSDNFMPEWIRTGGENGDLRVSYAVIAPPDIPIK